MAKQLFTFRETIDRIARAEWGASHDNADAAEKAIVDRPNDLTAATLIELVRRFNVFIEEMGRDDNKVERREIEESDEDKKFVGLKAGDQLYTCDLECGLRAHAVTYVSESGSAAVVELEQPAFSWVWTAFADDTYYATPAEALKHAARYDMQYHGNRVKFAEDCLAALASGGDLSEFKAGREYDDDYSEGDA